MATRQSCQTERRENQRRGGGCSYGTIAESVKRLVVVVGGGGLLVESGIVEVSLFWSYRRRRGIVHDGLYWQLRVARMFLNRGPQG